MALRGCARVGCVALVRKGYCAVHAKDAPKARIEAARPSAAKRGYGRQWQRQREAYLREKPFCADPYGVHGARLEEATVLDHIVPHKGDRALFEDAGNRQGLCKACHDRKTATEDSGFAGRRW